jgi:hypothetical protein
MFSAAFGVEDSHVVVGDDVYGGTRRLFDQVRRQSAGIETIYAELTDVEALTAAIAPELGFRGRLNTVSILSCTPPPNTSTATPTWWVTSWSSVTIPSFATTWHSCKMLPAQFSGHSILFWRCAELKHSLCAWSSRRQLCKSRVLATSPQIRDSKRHTVTGCR